VSQRDVLVLLHHVAHWFRLYAESIPHTPDLLKPLFDAYFDHVHPLRCLGFIHKPSFMQAFERDTLSEEYTQPLIYIMCAFGAKHLCCKNEELMRGHHDKTEPPGAHWARVAREMAMKGMETPTIQNLMVSAFPMHLYWMFVDHCARP